MPKIIGDDVSAFIKNARQKNCVPPGFLVPMPIRRLSRARTYTLRFHARRHLQTLTEGKAIEGRCTAS